MTTTPKPSSKPAMSDARISGLIAAGVLVFLAVFVVAFVWMGS